VPGLEAGAGLPRQGSREAKGGTVTPAEAALIEAKELFRQPGPALWGTPDISLVLRHRMANDDLRWCGRTATPGQAIVLAPVAHGPFCLARP
jgi:hypothetical protein